MSLTFHEKYGIISNVQLVNYYKYNVLPKSLESHRLSLERMAIRDMANFLENKADIPNIEISAYKLANRKIDR